LSGAERGIAPKPAGEVGEELIGISKIGILGNGKEAGAPLLACTKSPSSRAKGLGNDTGAVGGVKPVFPTGLDKERPESRLPLGLPAVLEGEVRCGFPGEVIEDEGLVDREAFEVLRMPGHK
jgi:hypothetical protein